MIKIANYDVMDYSIGYKIAEIIQSKFEDMSAKEIYELLNNLTPTRNGGTTVSNFVISNFYKVPIDIQNLLFRVADTFYGAGSVAIAIESNFYALPDDIRNQLLLKLADKESAISYVFNKVISKMNELPPDVRDQLLLKLASKESLVVGIIKPIILDFHQLPENIRNILFELANKPNLAWWLGANLATAIVSNFDKLPEEVTIKLLTILVDKSPYCVFRELAYNFDKLPENVRNLLLRVPENKDAAQNIAYFVTDNFDKLS